MSSRPSGTGSSSPSSAAEPPAQLVKTILDKGTVADVVRLQIAGQSSGGLVRCLSNEDLLTVVERLSNARVSAAPVFDHKNPNSCVGLIDYSDLVGYLIKMDLDSFKDSEQAWAAINSVHVSHCIDMSERNPLVAISPTATLTEAVKLIKLKGLRRAVVTKGNDVVAILSPSAIIRHMMQGLKGRNDALLIKSVEDLRCGHGPVNCVKKTSPLIEAFHGMFVSKQSVIAVVDHQTGALSGSISMSDIKTVFLLKRFGMLTESCWKYIVDARERSDTEVYPFFGVLPNDSLQMVCYKLLATNVHHLYIVDDSHKPHSVISFGEICSTLCNHLKL
jgi:CBS domain-containing protein